MNRRHAFHILPLNPWPILSAFSAFITLSGMAFYMHNILSGGYLFLLGLLSLIFCVFFWCSDIVDEATCSGYHTNVVREGLRLGFLLFIASEFMLFFGFFWAFFHASLCPAVEIGSVFPPEGVEVIFASEFPLYNTMILITSGFSVTWAHRSVCLGWYSDAIDALGITIILGFFFIYLQANEYYEAFFNYSDGVYGCSFYMLTGLHGCHVIVGAGALLVCFIRLLSRHYLTTHYLGFVFAIWYWHFVDAVWIVLFLLVYCWGGW